MATLNMSPGSSADLGLYLVTAMDFANITSSSATQIVMTEGWRTFTLTGSGFSVTNIGGVDYINGGTVQTISIDEGAGTLVSFADLAMAGATLRNVTRADRESTNDVQKQDDGQQKGHLRLKLHGKKQPENDTGSQGHTGEQNRAPGCH